MLAAVIGLSAEAVRLRAAVPQLTEPAAAPELTRSEVDALLLELVDTLRWPQRLPHGVAWLYSPGDVAQDGRSLVVGARFVDLCADFALPARHGRLETARPEEALRALFAPLARGRRVDEPSLRSPNAAAGTLELRPKGSAGRDLRVVVTRVQLAAKPADPVEKALVAAGFERARAFSIRFLDLDALLPDASERRAFLSGPLAGRLRRLSWSSTPRETALGRDRWLAARGQARPRARVWHSRLSAKAAGLRAIGLDRPTREAARERAIASFLRGLRWPLPPPKQAWRYVMRGDDVVGRSGLGEHDALDLGQLVNDAGRFAGWPVGTPIAAPHVDARPAPALRERSDAWLVRSRSGDAELTIWLGAYHVEGGALIGWNGSQEHASWRSSDSAWRLLGLPKPSHVHLECVGAYEDVARNRLFVATRLLPALQRSAQRRSPGKAAPRVLTADTRARRAARVLSDLAAALPQLPRVLLLKADAAAEAWSLALPSPPLRLDASFRAKGRGFAVRLPHGCQLRLGPALAGRAQQLQPGRLEVRLEIPAQTLPGFDEGERTLLGRRVLRLLAAEDRSRRAKEEAAAGSKK